MRDNFKRIKNWSQNKKFRSKTRDLIRKAKKKKKKKKYQNLFPLKKIQGLFGNISDRIQIKAIRHKKHCPKNLR